MRKFKWRVNENMQGKNVQSASGTNVFTGTWLLLLQIPVSADHSVDIKKNTYPCGPKSGSQTTSEINVQNYITLKGGISNLERSHRLPRVFNNFHRFPQANVRPLQYILHVSYCRVFCGGSHIFLDNSIFYDYIFNVHCPSIFL